MAAVKDMKGLVFGKLIVLEKSHSHNGVYWKCKCDCGNFSIVKGTNLRNGATKSCGCGSIEQAKQNLKDSRIKTTKHGCSHKERLYDTWLNMKRRCYDKTNKRYMFYGGKGVIVCDEWRTDYMNFRNWAVNNGYSENLTIDRIDNNGNYESSNCRWATATEQTNNQSRNHYITYKNKTQTVAQWAREFGISYGAMQHRVQKKWSMSRIEQQKMRVGNYGVKKLSNRNN